MPGSVPCLDPTSFRAEKTELTGAIEMQVGLPEGRIVWFDGTGKPLGHASIRAILSFAANNDSILWSWSSADFVQANIPVVPRSALSDEGYILHSELEQAEQLAVTAAAHAGATCVLTLQSGATTLFVAIEAFATGGPVAFGAETIESSTRDHLRTTLSNVAARMSMGGDDEARDLARNALLRLRNDDPAMQHALRSPELRRALEAIELAAGQANSEAVLEAIAAAVQLH